MWAPVPRNGQRQELEDELYMKYTMYTKILTTLAISIPISSIAKVWLITTRMLYLFVICSLRLIG